MLVDAVASRTPLSASAIHWLPFWFSCRFYTLMFRWWCFVWLWSRACLEGFASRFYCLSSDAWLSTRMDYISVSNRFHDISYCSDQCLEEGDVRKRCEPWEFTIQRSMVDFYSLRIWWRRITALKNRDDSMHSPPYYKVRSPARLRY